MSATSIAARLFFTSALPFVETIMKFHRNCHDTNLTRGCRPQNISRVGDQVWLSNIEVVLLSQRLKSSKRRIKQL
jgi:hypothetical protein